MKKTIQTTIRFPEELYKRLKEQSKERGISFNAVVLMALWKNETK